MTRLGWALVALAALAFFFVGVLAPTVDHARALDRAHQEMR